MIFHCLDYIEKYIISLGGYLTNKVLYLKLREKRKREKKNSFRFASLFPHGLIALLYMLYFKFSWINDLQKESNEGGMTIRVQKNIITGFKIFLFSEIMVFFSCFWVFIHFGLVPNIFVWMNFPPKGIVAIFPFGIPLANVLILLSKRYYN